MQAKEETQEELIERFIKLLRELRQLEELERELNNVGKDIKGAHSL